MTNDTHIGENIRNIRLLRGMKQTAFAKELGIAQQNVSKMERKKKLSPEKLKAAAEALGLTVDAVKNFNEKLQFNNNFALEENSGQVIHPVNDVIAYFKEELSKKDKIIMKLQSQLKRLDKTTKRDSQGASTQVRSITEKVKRAAK